MNGADDAPPDFDFDAPDFDIDAFERDVTPMDVAELDRLQSQIRAGTGAPGTGGEADPFADPFAVQDPMVGPEGEGEPPKKRRPIAKVDADRLLGKDGYPALIRMARKWKPKGKGHEVSVVWCWSYWGLG
jgi:replication fork protection complex subunit Csm3/Swi3